MSNTKHTPTPWAAGGSVIEREGETIAQAFRMTGCPIDQPVVNAAFIVRAVNSYAPLVEALRKIACVTPGSVADERAAVGDWSHFREPESVQIARAALAAAEAA